MEHRFVTVQKEFRNSSWTHALSGSHRHGPPVTAHQWANTLADNGRSAAASFSSSYQQVSEAPTTTKPNASNLSLYWLYVGWRGELVESPMGIRSVILHGETKCLIYRRQAAASCMKEPSGCHFSFL